MERDELIALLLKAEEFKQSLLKKLGLTEIPKTEDENKGDKDDK